MKSNYHTNLYGKQPDDHTEKLATIKENYINSTLKTLNNLGCNAKQTTNVADSNLSISINRQLQLSALPQAWLTGISQRLPKLLFWFPHQISHRKSNVKINAHKTWFLSNSIIINHRVNC